MSLKKALNGELSRTIDVIRKNKTFLITTHINPEADAIGSELAFSRLLKKLNKEGCIINESKIPEECKFLPGIDTIKIFPRKSGEFNDSTSRFDKLATLSKVEGLTINPERSRRIDCMVFLDCSELSRAGRTGELLSPEKNSLNIDHHISNTRFTKVNWVIPDASSTCEMVYRLYRELKVEIDADAALMLYSGMMVDTGSFRYNNASAKSYRVAASLIEKGVSPRFVYNRLFENSKFADIKLLSEVLSTIRHDARGRIAWANISRKILKSKFASIDLAETALSIMRAIAGVELAIIFKEVKDQKGKIRLNFRSQSKFDCNRLACGFGGGGHKNASGATVSGDLIEIKNKVIRQARKMMAGVSTRMDTDLKTGINT